jgi:TolB protein
MLTIRPLTRRFFAALALVCASPLAVAQLHFEINNVGANQIPIAVANFTGDPTPPTDLPQVIRDDLANSGVFRTVDAGSTPINETAQVDLASWKAHGADALLAGSIAHLADGRNDVRFRLYDTVKQFSPGGQALTGAAGNPRQTAHNIADFVYEKLTGVKGVFSTRIAYVIKKSAQLYELQIADADGKNPKAALTSREPIISPTWSPDGSRLAYVSFEQKKPVVYVHIINTGTRSAVSNFKGSNSAPAWSPDGQALAVVLTRDGNSQIYLMAADGSGLRRLTQSGGIDTEPVFAPDGQSIYFTSDRGGGPQVYRMGANGGDAARVTFHGDYNISPRISPDGKTLVYVSRRNGHFQLYSLDLASSQETLLTDTFKDESPSFAPNGKMLLYATEVGGRGVLAAVSIDGAVRLRLPLDESGDVHEPAWGPFTK